MIIDEYPISDCEVQNSSESVILDSLPSSFTSISVPTSVQQQCAICNKSLKIPKWQSGIINQRGTDNVMAKRKGTKGPTTIYNALYRKLKFEQQQHYKIRAVNSQSGHLLSIYFLCHIGLWLRSSTTCLTSFSVVPAISKIPPQSQVFIGLFEISVRICISNKINRFNKNVDITFSAHDAFLE